MYSRVPSATIFPPKNFRILLITFEQNNGSFCNFSIWFGLLALHLGGEKAFSDVLFIFVLEKPSKFFGGTSRTMRLTVGAMH